MRSLCFADIVSDHVSLKVLSSRMQLWFNLGRCLLRTLAIVFAALIGIGFTAIKAEAADYKQYQRQALQTQQKLERQLLEQRMRASNVHGHQRTQAIRQMQNKHQLQWQALNNQHRNQYYYDTNRARQQQQYRQWQQQQYDARYRNWQYNQRYRYPNYNRNWNNQWNRGYCPPNNYPRSSFSFGNGSFRIIIR